MSIYCVWRDGIIVFRDHLFIKLAAWMNPFTTLQVFSMIFWLRIPDSNDAKIAKICNFWTFFVGFWIEGLLVELQARMSRDWRFLLFWYHNYQVLLRDRVQRSMSKKKEIHCEGRRGGLNHCSYPGRHWFFFFK